MEYGVLRMYVIITLLLGSLVLCIYVIVISTWTNMIS
jgi:hypothetical protein